MFNKFDLNLSLNVLLKNLPTIVFKMLNFLPLNKTFVINFLNKIFKIIENLIYS